MMMLARDIPANIYSAKYVMVSRTNQTCGFYDVFGQSVKHPSLHNPKNCNVDQGTNILILKVLGKFYIMHTYSSHNYNSSIALLGRGEAQLWKGNHKILKTNFVL
jgi:hypothetical protein